MHQDTQADRSTADAAPRTTDITTDITGVTGGDGPGITEELLVEEVSIDGMCGVY
ncbi:MAG TPA: mycofactocin precursor MftA [Streptosporangiaceae bacterium]|jgi:mycofactocin precursor